MSETSCCAAVIEPPETTCNCGDQCQCAPEKPVESLPVVPIHQSVNDQVQLLVLTIDGELIVDSLTDAEFGRQSFTAYRPALSAQQFCALLSRFTC